MESFQEEDSSGPSSLSSDQASLCVIPDPYDSSEEDGFICLDKSSLPGSLNQSEQDRTVIVFHSVDEEYPANKDIVCQYIRPDGWEENPKDHICLFKVGWVTKNDAIFMVSLPSPSNDRIGRVLIPVNILPKDITNLFQFCYMREYTLLGASTPFQFMVPPTENDTSFEKTIGVDVLSKYNGKVQRGCHNLLCSQSQDIPVSLSNEPTKDIIQISSNEKQKYSMDPKEITHQPDDELNRSCYSLLSEEPLENLKAEANGVPVKIGETSIDKNVYMTELISHSHCFDQELKTSKKCTENELSYLKQRFAEINEEKTWYQDQYHSLLIAIKKYAEDLSTECAEKVSLNGHLAELTINHKMLCSENIRLSNELAELKQKDKENLDRIEVENMELQQKIHQLLLENMQLKEEMKSFQAQSKTTSESKALGDTAVSQECKCKKHKEQVEDLIATLADYEVIRNSLEEELDEEIKLGQEKDRYIVELEQGKVHKLQIASNWLASTPNATADGNALLEMEENMNSTIEALECALKEMEVLRSRKAAMNRANRVLREEFIQKRAEWEARIVKQKQEFTAQVDALQEQVQDERLSKNSLLKEIETLHEQIDQLAVEKQLLYVDQQKGAMEATKTKIESHHKQKLQIEGESILPKQSFARNMEVEEDVNHSLLKNLQEARDEYTKLYTEKVRIQEKLSRLQQKVKSKKVSRAFQETSLSASVQADFMDNVSSSWRATIDELM